MFFDSILVLFWFSDFQSILFEEKTATSFTIRAKESVSFFLMNKTKIFLFFLITFHFSWLSSERKLNEEKMFNIFCLGLQSVNHSIMTMMMMMIATRKQQQQGNNWCWKKVKASNKTCCLFTTLHHHYHHKKKCTHDLIYVIFLINLI